MAFISLATITQAAVNRRTQHLRAGKRPTYPISISMHDSHKRAPFLVVRLSAEMAKLLHVFPGDRADIMFDKETRECIIYRCPKGGYALHQGDYNKKIVGGEHTALVMKTRWQEGMIWADGLCHASDVKADQNGLNFILPSGILFNKAAPQ